jgi:hypothetical protein
MGISARFGSRTIMSVVAMALTGLSVACASNGSAHSAGTPVPMRVSGDGSVGSVAELDGQIFAIVDPPDSDLGLPSTLWRYTPGAATENLGAVPIDGACAEPLLGELRVIGPHVLGAVAQCTNEAGDEANLYVSIKVVASHASARIIAHVPSAFYSVAYSNNRPEGWVAYAGYDTCEAIGHLTADGPETLGPIELSSQLTWRPDAGVNGEDAADCTSRGRAAFVATAINSRTLFFMASSEAIGKAQSSKARVDSIWAIFQLDSDTGRTKMISTGFRQPVGIDVAPDSAQLLVAGYYSGQQGLWLIDVTSGKVDRVALGNFSGPRFGDTDILALRFPDRGRAVAVQFSRS